MLRQTPYMLLPVAINGTWFSNPGIEAMHQPFLALKWGNHFVGAFEELSHLLSCQLRP